MTLVAGVDSSTQACKVVIRDAETGALVRHGRAPHPLGTEVHPDAWWAALRMAIGDAGGLADVEVVSVAAQQHAMICLDSEGKVVRPALLWNDLRSATAAVELVAEWGAHRWADAVGSVPVASFTVTKLRWFAENEPDLAARAEAVCLPHDWLTWRLGDNARLVTDRGDASGTGYWSPSSGAYRDDLLRKAFGRDLRVPEVLAPRSTAGSTPRGVLLGPGTGDNAAAALGLGAAPGDVVVSVGTSGTIFTPASHPAADATGAIAGFADATGIFLPLVCTLNASRVLDAAARLLGVDLETLSRLALSVPAGAEGLVLVPYLDGERTPNEPQASGSLHGLTQANTTPAHLARAAVEGMLCALADGLDALVAHGVKPRRVLLIGGGAVSPAVRQLAPEIFGCPVVIPAASQYVADGAARQAAWVLSGQSSPPMWRDEQATVFKATPNSAVRKRYREARELTLERA
jgi:xylulokinase